ncbi:hypothetical protein [Nocardia cyriacigeorgica]|uniref:hypothetical protein n=1 Tax=Nocardia cyriacigeorgica TaxID=135487 RepID=UPI002493B093|nr:hypothetical protein [Nocardia cyriacigeorgica]BDU05431.1 hypothetical protein FMUBM48_16940 [Nocardia cyriacigeorgica]
MNSVNPEFDPTTLTAAQADGFECVAGCGYNQITDRDRSRTMRPVGHGPRGQVFVCSDCDRRRDEIADQAARARALADLAEARAATYVPQPGHRIEFYVRRATPSGRVEIDVAEGLVQRVDTETGCVVIGDDDVPDWFVPLADVVGRIPGGLAANISRFVCWVRGNYGRTVCPSDLLDVLRAVQFDSDDIQQAALRAAADRIVWRRADGVTMTAADLLEYVDSLPSTGEPPVDRIARRAAESAPVVREVREVAADEHPISCDGCA